MADVEQKDTIVAGGGPGGYVVVTQASELSQKVTLINKGEPGLGGVCLNVGCAPSRASIAAGHRCQETLNSSTYGISKTNAKLDSTKTQGRKDHKVVDRMIRGAKMLSKKYKVEIIDGEVILDNGHQLRVIEPGPKQFTDNDNSRTITWKSLIFAIGSHSVETPHSKFEGRVIDSTGGLNLKEAPEESVVIGGDYIGTELAGAYADLGAHVTIIEGADSTLGGFDHNTADIVVKNLEKKGVDTITKATAKDPQQDENSVTVIHEVNGSEKSIKAGYYMVSVGRKPDIDDFGLGMTNVRLNGRHQVIVDEQGRTNVPGIWAIGDIVPGPTLAHKTSFEAKIAAGAIAGKNTINDWVGVPMVCFADPELAQVGMTVEEAKDKGIDVPTAQFPFAGNARAVSLDAAEGSIRLIYIKDEKNVIGAQGVSPGVSDLAGEFSLIANCGMNVEDVALTTHPHPTLNEPVQGATDVALDFPTHT